MTVPFAHVKLHDKVDLPCRKGEPDRYVVIWKHNDRIKLESLLEKGRLRYFTENQFNDAGFELAGAETTGE